MATKQLNTRIRVRYDTLSNWNTNNPDLLKGEIAVVEIPASTNAGVVISEPAYLIKVGTGESGTTTSYGGATGQPAINKTSFKALPYVTAQAGDVYNWAKTANPPTAEQLYMGSSGDNATTTIASAISSILASGGDTNTVYDVQFGDGTNGDIGQIRIGVGDGTITPVSYVYGNWHTVGNAVAAGNGIAVSTSGGTATVSTKISSATTNILSLNNTSGEEGLYVPKAIVTPYSATAQSNDGTVDVLTNISTSDGYTFTQTPVNIYTKNKIDTLINPGMEFKGVKTAAQLDAITLTGAMLGDSYKLSDAGTSSLTAVPLKTVKAGDLAIVVEGSTSGTYEWAIIPAGDDVEDTWRPLYVNGTDTQLPYGGVFNTAAGTGISLGVSGLYDDNSNVIGGTLTINVDTSTIATKASVDNLNTHTGYGSGANQLTKTVNVEGTPTVQQATVKEYVDNKFDETLTSASATIASISDNIVTLKAGIASSNQAVSNSSGSDIVLAKIAKTGKAIDLSTADDEYLILFGGTSWDDFIDSTVAADHTTT